MVRHALRTLIEADDVAVVEATDGDEALTELALARFDLLVLELDLPVQDGVSVMLAHRVLLAHQQSRVDAPDVILTIPPEARGNQMLTGHLHGLGVAGLIDDDPRSDAASLIEATLRARTSHAAKGKPAAA